MTTAQTLYREGKLQSAVEQALQEVKDQPASATARAFLAELLCIQGDYQRADNQLNTLVTLEPASLLMVNTWRQLIRASQARQDVYQRNAVPAVIDQPGPRIENALGLLLALQEQNLDKANECLARVDANTPADEDSPFIVNGQRTWLRDLDDINAGILEVMGANGKYFWIEYEDIRELRLHQPQRPLDVIWRKATLVLSNGTEGEVFIPAIYPDSETDSQLLGLSTDWHEQGDVMRGQGLRNWLCGEAVVSMNELDSVNWAVLVEAGEA
ncbi:type VI secretion system accessory protein TagJ [Oceanobacter mangrovi]|uniref:type VI secretion system accessory protein TagJ n=1 Tax=Oceanobacter mangrovi TaxID=2862510 RepID=UPI001C8D562D|nr:type VI secretion system accessory protein TagJ [Oceanobacter mangrovi]